jgi:hypothetical protein
MLQCVVGNGDDNTKAVVVVNGNNNDDDDDQLAVTDIATTSSPFTNRIIGAEPLKMMPRHSTRWFVLWFGCSDCAVESYPTIAPTLLLLLFSLIRLDILISE